MKTDPVNISMFRQASAWLPLAMSLAALTLVIAHAIVFGIIHEGDEGAAAHVFQILMAGQLPVVAYFAITRLPGQPGQALMVLAMQAGTWLAAWASVFFLT